MPSSSEMKSALQRYLDFFNAGDPKAVASLFAETATVEDPIGTPATVGRAAIEEFYTQAMAGGAKLELVPPIRGSHGNAAAMAFQVKVGPMVIHVIDVMTFDDSGKISSMRAHWGPDDMEQPG